MDLTPGVPTEIDTPSGKVTITYSPGTPGSETDKPSISYEYELTKRTGGNNTFDEFNVTITDADGDTTTATVVVDIIDDVPTAENDTNDITKEGDKHVTVDGDVFENDVIGADGSDASGPVTGVVSGGTGTPTTGVGVPVEGQYGSITIKPDGSYTYTLDPEKVKDLTADETWDEVFTYTITDKDGDTSTAQLTITIHGNTPPVAKPDINVVPEDTPATGNILTNDSDPDDDPFEVTGFTVGDKTYPPGSTVQIPGVGEITIGTNGDYTFTPVPDWNGKVPTIDYTVTDKNGGTATSTLDITVTPIPDAVDDATTTEPGVPVTMDPLGNDKFSNPDAKITDVTPGSNGIVTITPDGRVTYTPNPGFEGTDTFTYTVTSGGKTETATVTVTVQGQHVAPPPPPFHGNPPSQTPVVTTSPLVRDTVRDPSVYFHDEAFDRVDRMRLPFHPIVYVNRQVQESQGERAQDDVRFFSNPNWVDPGRTESTSIGAGLGQDPNLFVQHSVRDTQTRAGFLARLVEGRLGRLSLSSDRLLPTPDLFEPTPNNMTPDAEAATNEAPENTEVDPGNVPGDQVSDDTELNDEALVSSGAPSFTEQLRGGSARLPATLFAPYKSV